MTRLIIIINIYENIQMYIVYSLSYQILYYCDCQKNLLLSI